MKKLGILVGEGIECEKETKRFFKEVNFFGEIVEIAIPRLLDEPKFLYNTFKENDWIVIPGGFAFADHYGAGKLLSYQLRKVAFFENIKQLNLHCFGICNGFQMLCESDVFGSDVRLLKNSSSKASGHFCNRWVSLKSSENLDSLELTIPVRHGEGRLQSKTGAFQQHVSPFLNYTDDEFDNGSLDQVAGLVARYGKASFWGMMPHPEIVLKPVNNPNTVGAEYFPKIQSRVLENSGDGVKLFTAIKEYLDQEV